MEYFKVVFMAVDYIDKVALCLVINKEVIIMVINKAVIIMVINKANNSDFKGYIRGIYL
jgi:hypothetical protein